MAKDVSKSAAPSGAVLITGAGSGIGRALAEEFARNGHALIISSRDPKELQQAASELTNDYDVCVDAIAADLENPKSPQRIFDFVSARSLDVGVLVNNAGLGHMGSFWELSIEDQMSIVGVNISAVLRLTHLFVPEMLKRGGGRILNTASVAGFNPGPTLAVYHASKAFVLSFSEALATELEEQGITVTALCPGATDTNFFPKAHMTDTKIFQKGKIMSPHEVAQIGYKACMEGERLVVAGGMNKAMVFARRFFSESALAKQNKKFYEKVSTEDRKRKRGDFEAKVKFNSQNTL